jgi:hypothetical protein
MIYIQGMRAGKTALLKELTNDSELPNSYLFKKAVVISKCELIKKGTNVTIIGTVGNRKYRVADKNNTSYTVMKESVEVKSYDKV